MRHSGAALALTLTISLTLGANVVAKHSTEHKYLLYKVCASLSIISIIA